MQPSRLRLGPLDLHGFSRSGLATYVLVPELDACFDLGHCDPAAAGLSHVLLSHVHHDHAGGLVRHLRLRALSGARPPRVYVPAESRDDLLHTLRAHERMERAAPQDLDSVVRGVSPGDSFPLSSRYSVRAFDVRHRAPSRGYTVTETRRKLKPAYLGLPGPEVGRLVQQGVQVADLTTHDLLTYVGDSTVETLHLHPELGRSEILLLEATYLPPDPTSAAARYGHTHLSELVDLHLRHPETLASPYLVLKHFSLKYGESQVRQALQALPDGLRQRTTALL
jgi:ribonuclease Z